jgi:hypothetical protein
VQNIDHWIVTLMKKFITTLAIALLASSQVSADALKTEADVRLHADKIMVKVANGDLSGAFEVLKPYVVISESEFQSAALQSKAQREQYSNRYGKSIGYELFKEKRMGESLIRFVYGEKTERHVLPWIFVYYKTSSGWVLNSFMWNDQVATLFNLD